jgi:glucosamine--fructose-6-phosphate aminotransferase (isomerizing)
MSASVLEYILGQPKALRAVAAYHFGPGREALLHAAALMTESKQIIFSGMGASLFACIPAQYIFVQRGIPTSVVESSELLYFLSGMLEPNTTLVLVSRSGESIEVTKLLPILRERGCRAIAVVNGAGSTLAKQADETILINSPAEGYVAIQAYTSTVAVLCMLAAACSGEIDHARTELDRAINAAETMLASNAPGAAQEKPPFERGTLYLLGRGPSLASVYGGALLMHEMARMPAIGMSSAQFRHGPVEVVSREFQAIVFGSQSETADIDLRLAEDLASVGKCVRWIGPHVSGSKVDGLSFWPPDVPPRYAPLLEVLPVQILAFRLAEAGGIQAGQFRFAAPVTLSETGFGREK